MFISVTIEGVMLLMSRNHLLFYFVGAWSSAAYICLNGHEYILKCKHSERSCN